MGLYKKHGIILSIFLTCGIFEAIKDQKKTQEFSEFNNAYKNFKQNLYSELNDLLNNLDNLFDDKLNNLSSLKNNNSPNGFKSYSEAIKALESIKKDLLNNIKLDNTDNYFESLSEKFEVLKSIKDKYLT